MISGLVVLSEPENMCYPYLESIKSFLPVVDEMVVVWNPLVNDGGREKVEQLDKIRIVQAAFDLERFGWISYGIARTTGYQACNGDTVVMFDADGVLHEAEITKLQERLKVFENKAVTHPYAYWRKFRFYKPTQYHLQNKHSGIYSKKILGDRFDFYRGEKGVPNWELLRENEKSHQFDITLYGYEHIWDTEEVLHKKIVRYGTMADKLHQKNIKTDDYYIKAYMEKVKTKIKEEGKTLTISEQPAIIQPKLKAVTEDQFGHAWFE